MKIKDRKKAIIAMIISLAFILVGSSVKTELTTVSIQPPSQIVERNQTFNISVYVEPSEPIMGAVFDYLYYDADLIHANSVTEGDLFDDYIMFNDGDIDNENGIISNVFLLANPDDAVSEPGSFVDIEFTALDQFGASELDLEGVIITNITGISLPLEINDGEVIVEIEDTTPPVTTCELEGEMQGEIYISNVTVILNATDDMSGVNYTMCKLDTSSWQEYLEPFVVSGNGEHIVYFYSVDNAENIELEKNCTFTIQIDTTPPETTCELEGEMQGEIYISDVMVTLTATDDMSGVNYTMCKLNDGSWQEYSEPFVVSEDGNHTVYFYSVDNAENIEDTKSETFAIQHPCPIEIDISGGFGVNAIIKNTCDVEITDIEWSITVDGNFIFYGQEKTGTIASLSAGGEIEIQSFILGIGQTEIVVTAGCASETAEGFLLLFYMII